jgi:hypothetical protein
MTTAPPTMAPTMMKIASTRPPITVRARRWRRGAIPPDELIETLLQMYL